MANVVLKKVTKAFGDVVVQKDIDLEIIDGEFIAFVGPSGCGNILRGQFQPRLRGCLFYHPSPIISRGPAQKQVLQNNILLCGTRPDRRVSLDRSCVKFSGLCDEE